MTTVATLIERTRRELYGGHRPQLNALASACGSGDASISLSFDLGPVMQAAYLGIDNEILYVISNDRATRTAQVLRGQLGTTAAAHAQNAVVEANPRFYRAQVNDTMLDEVRSWPNNVYRVKTLSLTTANDTLGYDAAGIDPNWLRILELRRAPNLTTGLTSNKLYPKVSFEASRNVDPAIYPSGTAIFLNDYLIAGVGMRLTYAAPFTTSAWGETADLEADLGIGATLEDVLRYGTLWRLLSGREIPRTDLTDAVVPGQEQDVPAGIISQSAAALLRVRDRRLDDEAKRLLDLYGNW